MLGSAHRAIPIRYLNDLDFRRVTQIPYFSLLPVIIFIFFLYRARNFIVAKNLIRNMFTVFIRISSYTEALKCFQSPSY